MRKSGAEKAGLSQEAESCPTHYPLLPGGLRWWQSSGRTPYSRREPGPHPLRGGPACCWGAGELRGSQSASCTVRVGKATSMGEKQPEGNESHRTRWKMDLFG